ncbi:histidine kinase [Chthoniobacter flavus Ellin428]|uniref:histidine kinase n=1 Tax=Chthoniobacter flavus Ellin428 TaxID=497964 RepID=B4D6W0_9BACT|nr:response regulator [Chthoniobacter flavus]EDY17911.1 histidine kinase [Chthoniobacter flavus Ellin428]TCO88518.1 response regulator receiver domain-containing protein [Chthoniobacter flavus]
MNLHTHRRILVIDDNRAIHGDFCKILCPQRSIIDQEDPELFAEITPTQAQPFFEIDSAYQGTEGVCALSRALEEGRPYAMAFVDWGMPPGADGIETVEMLWKRCPELQVVICTAYSDYSWAETIGRLGHRDHLLVLKKPFAPVEALQLASALCEKWRLAEEARHCLADRERILEERTRECCEMNQRLKAEMEQRMQAEAQLLRAQRLESIGTLASGIAHDLNNMLSPILLSLDLLRNEVPEKSRELLSTVERCAQRAGEMVKQVLTFARGVEGERLPLQPKLLIREIENIVAGSFPRHITMERRIPRELSLIQGDPTQLHQVLLNLCVNARDAMPDGGTLRIEADDFAVDAHFASMTPGARIGRYVRLRVSDTGTGIPAHLIDKIFDPFFTTKPLGKGTGLGLFTVIGIVKSHEGFLNVHSEPGKGTTLEIFIPTVLDDAPCDAPKEKGASRNGGGQLILVVDDESAVRDVIESTLTQHGYRTLLARDGAEALTLFVRQTERIDVVFTDITMPLVDGVALCRALKMIDREVRIIAATGVAEEHRKRDLESLNIGRCTRQAIHRRHAPRRPRRNSLITKPFRPLRILIAAPSRPTVAV